MAVSSSFAARSDNASRTSAAAALAPVLPLEGSGAGSGGDVAATVVIGCGTAPVVGEAASAAVGAASSAGSGILGAAELAAGNGICGAAATVAWGVAAGAGSGGAISGVLVEGAAPSAPIAEAATCEPSLPNALLAGPTRATTAFSISRKSCSICTH